MVDEAAEAEARRQKKEKKAEKKAKREEKTEREMVRGCTLRPPIELEFYALPK